GDGRSFPSRNGKVRLSLLRLARTLSAVFSRSSSTVSRSVSRGIGCARSFTSRDVKVRPIGRVRGRQRRGSVVFVGFSRVIGHNVVADWPCCAAYLWLFLP